ncbi:MFS transporter [Marinomonas rhizomae]|uniref:Sugar phosphate permease n=1 Tax=Marinomonas rhizomae TaxID=491948 RepID=A0A366JBI6_9GAMM|nr:MFS transporter [Marinomonas rhizomae]RBP83780.1 sugar phosphate permease [Marinomonas rhizomae]RNF73508.1 MFS transporter [Marinomonas rhizomae]
MPNDDNKYSPRKMILLGGLYTTQFLGLGFILTAVPAIMRDLGSSLSEISIMYTLGFIWSLKFLWAPLIDRFSPYKKQHYRSWLILFQSFMIVSLLCAALLDITAQYASLIVLFALFSIFSASQDIAADALGVTILEPEERGVGNSIQSSGGFIGNLIGGGVVLMTYEWIGWTGSLLILAMATALPLINIWRYKEPLRAANVHHENVRYSDMIAFFKRPNSGRWLSILITYTLGISIAYAIINPMLVDIGWSLDQIGFATSIIGSFAAISGAVLTGGLVQKIGRKRSMILANVLVGLSILILFAVAQGNNNTIVIYSSICFMLFAFGANSTMLATVMMDNSQKQTAGTDYTLQYSLSSIVGTGGVSSALLLAETFQYTGVLIISLCVTALSIIILNFNGRYIK